MRRKNLEDTVPIFGEKPLYTNITVEDVAKVMEREDMWLLFHYNEQALGDTEYDCHESLQVLSNVTRDVGGMFRIGVLSLDPNSVAGVNRPEAEAAGVDVRYLAQHVYALPPVKPVSKSNSTCSGYLDPVLLISKLNQAIFVYFDPENVFFDNKKQKNEVTKSKTKPRLPAWM